MEEILHQLRGSLAYYLQGFIHHRWCRISSINSKLWHLLSQCVSTSCVSRLSTLLPLGLWHSARPVVYGIVGRVSRTPTAIVLSRTCPDHVSKSAIWQFRQEIVQHVQHVPKHVQLHTLNSQAFHSCCLKARNKWYCMMTCGMFCSVKSRRIEKVKYSWKMMRLVYVLPVN